MGKAAGFRSARAVAILLVSVLVAAVVLSCYRPVTAGELRYVAVGIVFCVVLVLTLFLRLERISGQLLLCGALLVVLNLASAPLLHEPAPTLMPNYVGATRVVGDVMPGFTGIQRLVTDAKGFRTTAPVDYQSKPAGTFRVFAIGGSTTEQISLGNEKTWVALLEERLKERTGRRIETINAGVSGQRAEQHFITLQRIAPYQPDLVIIMMGINDWGRHIRMRESRVRELTSAMLDHLDMRQSVLIKAYVRAKAMVRKAVPAGPPRVEDYDGQYFSEQNDSLNRPVVSRFYPEDVSSNYRLYATKIADFCRSRRLTCVFVDQATAYRKEITPELKRRLWMTPPQESYTLSLENMGYIAGLYNGWLERFARSTGAPFCAIAKDVPPTTEFMYDDCHFNEAGARRVASLLAECLLGQGLVSTESHNGPTKGRGL